MRSISDENATILKDATAAAIVALGGTSKAASLLGVASSTMTKYASKADEWRESFVRLDVAAEMDRLSGHDFHASAMARITTHQTTGHFGAITPQLVLRLNGILNDVVHELAAALEDDGALDAAERLAVRKCIAIAQQKLTRLDVRICGGG